MNIFTLFLLVMFNELGKSKILRGIYKIGEQRSKVNNISNTMPICLINMWSKMYNYCIQTVVSKCLKQLTLTT